MKDLGLDIEALLEAGQRDAKVHDDKNRAIKSESLGYEIDTVGSGRRPSYADRRETSEYGDDQIKDSDGEKNSANGSDRSRRSWKNLPYYEDAGFYSRNGQGRQRSRSPKHDLYRGTGRRDNRDERDDRYDRHGREDHDNRRERSRDRRSYRDDRGRDRDRDRYNDRNRRDDRNRNRDSIKPAKPKTPEPTDDERDRRTVFVQQLAARLRTYELQEFFNKVGEVKEAQIVKDRVSGRSKGVGYVEFKDEESVKKAIDLTGQKLLGIPIIAQLTEAEKNRQARKTEGMPTQSNGIPFHRLYVGNIHFSLTEEDLSSIFANYGELEFVQIQKEDMGRSKGYGFVQYVFFLPHHVLTSCIGQH